MSEEEKVTFKKKSFKKPFRKREVSSDEEETEENEEDVRAKLEEMKSLQKLRRRPNGVSIVGLALGKKVSVEEEISVNDPFKTKTGGMIDMGALKSGKIKRNDDAYDTGIGTQFSAETNTRDEDEEMMKYIEEQLSKRKGQKKSSGEGEVVVNEASKYLSPEEAALQSVPDHLRASSTQRSEEMLSNQMLSGIPEVDLGIDAKIRNIEATEEAKLKLLWERHSKKDGPSQFVPTNMAVNFVQHNRFNIEESGPPAKKSKNVDPKKLVVVGSEPLDRPRRVRVAGEKATDDYHYEKFKKQFRRY
ncbi:telomere length and silencing protein 1 homolog isoform X1 [Ischnura elegans]|uniref:telomere length and silencing protein 1 homolog isoform X1 n=2 Tax=Ischnura elegans TaxID=197161 RepID=UPI001ED88DB8|nr:telomere length and silencing protein 1 homolog isoform X1 [Ischnura elegans]